MKPESSNVLISQLSNIILDFIAAVDKFPQTKREEILFSKWSLKDMLAHFSGWNILTIDELTILQNNQPLKPWIEDLDAFNADEVSKRKNIAWNDIYSEFKDSCYALLAKYKSLSEESWNSQFGPTAKDTPLNAIKIDIDHMEGDHLRDIKSIS